MTSSFDVCLSFSSLTGEAAFLKKGIGQKEKNDDSQDKIWKARRISRRYPMSTLKSKALSTVEVSFYQT